MNAVATDENMTIGYIASKLFVLCCFVSVTKVYPGNRGDAIWVGGGSEMLQFVGEFNSIPAGFVGCLLAGDHGFMAEKPHQGVDAERRRWRARSRLCVRISKHVGKVTDILLTAIR